MRGFLRKKLAGLCGCSSGNAAVLVGLGLPMLIGGAGLGVDLAQWYTWKRELQYAVDQAAIAGAWAKGADENGTTYIARATQEYNAALSQTQDFASAPTVTLDNYDGGTNNSILVVATATQELPFTSVLTGNATTVRVSAEAIYEPGTTYRPCFVALDPDDPNAFWMHGSVTVTATCGIGALSTHTGAVIADGDAGDIDVGFVVTGGGINDPHGHFDEEVTVEGSNYLEDPYLGLEPPESTGAGGPALPACPANNGKYIATENVSITTTYSYWIGPNKNDLESYDHPSPKEQTTTTTSTPGKQFNSAPPATPIVEAGKETIDQIPGGGNDKIWEKASPVTTTTYVTTYTPPSVATVSPGTYTSFSIECDTVLEPGVYVLDGATLTIQAGYKLSGEGVMLVLKNEAGFQVAGQAMIDLTAMDADQLASLGYSDEEVARMIGMLIFEDPESNGNDGNKLTGGSTQIFNGIIYTPKSDLEISGNPQGTSQCMVIATQKIKIGGTTDISSMCPSNVTPNAAAAETRNVVRLVG